MLVNILIFFFIFIICYQILVPLREGAEIQFIPYNPPTTNMPLDQQNENNIMFLKTQMETIQPTISPLKSQVTVLSNQVSTLTSEVSALTQQQASYASNLAGTSVPTISGTGATGSSS